MASNLVIGFWGCPPLSVTWYNIVVGNAKVGFFFEESPIVFAFLQTD